MIKRSKTNKKFFQRQHFKNEFLGVCLIKHRLKIKLVKNHLAFSVDNYHKSDKYKHLPKMK